MDEVNENFKDINKDVGFFSTFNINNIKTIHLSGFMYYKRLLFKINYSLIVLANSNILFIPLILIVLTMIFSQ